MAAAPSVQIPASSGVPAFLVRKSRQSNAPARHSHAKQTHQRPQSTVPYRATQSSRGLLPLTALCKPADGTRAHVAAIQSVGSLRRRYAASLHVPMQHKTTGAVTPRFSYAQQHWCRSTLVICVQLHSQAATAIRASQQDSHQLVRRHTAKRILQYIASFEEPPSTRLNNEVALLYCSSTSRLDSSMEQHCQPFNDSLNINNVDLAPWVHILPAHLTPPPPIAWHHFSGLVSADGMRGLKHGVECDVTHLPSISGAQGSHCQLARHDWVHTFADDGISQFVGSLFHALLEGRSSSASNWSNMVKPYAPVFLTRFDLFHGHMFVHAASDAASITNDAGNADCVFADDVSYMSQDNNHLHTHSNSHTYSNGDSHSCSSNHSSLTGPCIAATCSSGSSSSSTNCSDQHDHVGSSGMFIDEDEYNNMRYDSSSSSSSNDSSSSTASSHLSRSSAALPDVGILFHAAEYPQYDDTMFPYYLGYCQHGSSLEFDQRSMDLRNMLWFKVRTCIIMMKCRCASRGFCTVIKPLTCTTLKQVYHSFSSC